MLSIKNVTLRDLVAEVEYVKQHRTWRELSNEYLCADSAEMMARMYQAIYEQSLVAAPDVHWIQ